MIHSLRKLFLSADLFVSELYSCVARYRKFSYCSGTDHRRDREWVKESIGILKWKCAPIDQGLPIVDKAIIVENALENLGVDEASRTKPATVKVNPRDITAGDAHVHNLNSVGRYAAWKRSCGSLVYHNIGLRTLISPYSIRFVHCQCCVNRIQTRKWGFYNTFLRVVACAFEHLAANLHTTATQL